MNATECFVVRTLAVTLNVVDTLSICEIFMHLALVNNQLDTQFFYFIIRLLQYFTCFEQRGAHHQEVKMY